MLLEFKIKNYKSFRDEGILSLIPAPKQKDLEYSVLEKSAGDRLYKAISTSVIYGPNASGKTNIIGAIETLVKLINRGNIKNDQDGISLNIASNRLELIPNKDLKVAQPVEFYISFIKEKKHIEYKLILDLGLFLGETNKRRIIKEELVVNGTTEFLRNSIISRLNFSNSSSKDVLDMLSNNLNPQELFLSNGFKNIINNDLYSLIYEFINDDLIVIFRSESIKLSNKMVSSKDAYKDRQLSLVANEIGALNSDIGFRKHKDGETGVLTTFINLNDDNKSVLGIPSELIESLGTIRFLNLYPIIRSTLQNGGVLIIDEFDTSIHPMVLLEIVNIFHNDEININKAQLIFNTHNPVFLSSSVLRRDEIKFVEKDNNGSLIYSLADFKTSGESGVRRTDDYMKHYFVSKYGAILDVDLGNLFISEVDDEKVNK